MREHSLFRAKTQRMLVFTLYPEPQLHEYILSHNSRITPATDLWDVAQSLVDHALPKHNQDFSTVLSPGPTLEPPGEMQLQTTWRRPQPAGCHVPYTSLL